MLPVIRDQLVVYKGVGVYSMGGEALRERGLERERREEEIRPGPPWPDGQGFPHLLVLVSGLSRWSIRKSPLGSGTT